MKIITSLFVLSLLISCNKTEGPGGTSSITGTVKMQNHQSGQVEITEIICTPGSDVEHGDYWVLNNLIGAEQFYVYYDNPTWATESNPNLAGRTGIEVSFNYSDSNIEIAENTMTALNAQITADYTFSRNVDILTITSNSIGNISDADKVSTPFEFNTAQQGKNTLLENSIAAVDEKVYLVYGTHTNYDDFARTGGDGEYQFTNLTTGNYTVYALTKDTINGGKIKVLQTVEINSNKSAVVAKEISIIN